MTFFDSSLSDSSQAVKALTYGDAQEDLNSFCSKLLPILERLEVLKEVRKGKQSYETSTQTETI